MISSTAPSPQNTQTPSTKLEPIRVIPLPRDETPLKKHPSLKEWTSTGCFELRSMTLEHRTPTLDFSYNEKCTAVYCVITGSMILTEARPKADFTELGPGDIVVIPPGNPFNIAPNGNVALLLTLHYPPWYAEQSKTYQMDE
jgi:mannose-6-phosphate isomerase-like protein (cupin superfamily)